MLRLDGVGKHFARGPQALADIDLAIDERDFLVLLGPSGCGKSTMLRLIAGLETPSSGTLHWTGRRPVAGEIGYVFQDPVLMPWATALQNVSLPLRLRGVPDAVSRARHALAEIGLADFAGARPKTLSGGMRMRVSIARALVTRPRLLLMDEPFAALDEFTRHRLQDKCLSLTASLGCTTVFVTHSLAEAATLASRVVLLSPRPGRVATVLPGAPPDLRGRIGPGYAARLAGLQAATQALHLSA